MRLLPLGVLLYGGLTVLPVALVCGWALWGAPAQFYGIALAALIAAAGLSAWATRQLVKHIQRMLATILAIAQGQRGTQINATGGRGELFELAHSLNYMSSELKRYDDDQQALLATVQQGALDTVRALVNAIHARDPYTRGHANRVSRLSLLVGQEMGLDDEALLHLEYGSILHDIGKIAIRDHILLKPAQLSDDEMEIMRSHPEQGRRILATVSFLKPVVPLVYHHHEWFDGTGYPEHLAGANIPIGARIISAVDTYDALTSDRPYQKGRSFEGAKIVLEKLRGRQFDPLVLEALYVAIEKRQKARERTGDLHALSQPMATDPSYEDDEVDLTATPAALSAVAPR